MRKRLLVTTALAATTTLVSCDRNEAPAVTAATAPTPAKPAPPPLPIGVTPASDDHVPNAGPPPQETAIVPTGKWTENKMYRSRLERIAPCGAPAPALGPAQPTAAGGIGQLRGETSWVGALFTVQAKDKKVFVTPRDLELRRGGVILNARYINQPVLPACQPLLPVKQLAKDETASGFALFEVPKSFRTKTDDPIVLAFQPTRWGGGRRVEVPIRECLDACPEPSARKAAKTAGRASPASRPKL